MFNRGITRLLEALPELLDLDAAHIRRLLSAAYLDAVAQRDFPREGLSDGEPQTELRRLATALELHAVLFDPLPAEARRASAFVAAEVLDVLATDASSIGGADELDTPLGPVSRYERIESGLLYMAAGFDANAAVAEHHLGQRDASDATSQAAERAVSAIRSLLRGAHAPAAAAAPTAEPSELHDRVAVGLWGRIDTVVRGHIAWLRGDDARPQSDAPSALRDLAALLGPTGAPSHPEIHHLILLLTLACDATTDRALRSVPPPPEDDGRWARYIARRAARRPLLWPVAQDFVSSVLPGLRQHAVVTVPTGSGKSAVAELAAAHGVQRGWVLYLAPTRALVRQIVRDLRSALGGRDGTRIRGFVGGAEYTEAPGEALGTVGRDVLVMTPEKCSLALRQDSTAFRDLALCVFDECHLIGARDARGVVAELVLAEIMYRAPDVRVVLMSALVENAGELAAWLGAVTGVDACVIDEPWRPTRTLRVIACFDLPTANELGTEAAAFLESRPSRKRRAFEAPMVLLASLQGTFESDETDDYRALPISVTGPLAVIRADDGRLLPDSRGYLNPTAGALTQRLAESGHRVLTFLPRSKHDSFSVARDVPGVAPQRDLLNEIGALLRLARADLGTPSALEELLAKGVAVHTGAMLAEEQRASEIAFEQVGGARIMLATSTIAQGLNFPATAVIVGGTTIGDPRRETPTNLAVLLRSQALNAIGRAGRPYTATRSVAIVLPSAPVFLAPTDTAASAAEQVPFLREEDASTTITSGLDSLLRDVLGGLIDMRTMSASQQAAFAYLSFAADTADTADVVSRTFAAKRAAAAVDGKVVADALTMLGRRFLNDAGAPEWITAAAHRAGIQLPVIAALERQLERASLLTCPPTSLDGRAPWSLR